MLVRLHHISLVAFLRVCDAFYTVIPREIAANKKLHTPGGCLFSWVGTKWKGGTKWSHLRGGGVPLAGYQVVKGTKW